MTQLKLLLTGATGYVGGSVLTTLLTSSNPLIQQLSITALVRKQNQAETLRAQGVKPVLFRDLDDTEFIKTVASGHDVVIHTASGFHVDSAKALIEGLGERKSDTGREIHFIHTSGTWNFVDSRPPSMLSTRIFHDKDNHYDRLQRLESQKQFSQRTTLLEVISSAEKVGVTSYILMPPDIYGQGTGLFNQHTSQLFDLVRSAAKAGWPEYVGNSAGGAGHVHIADLANLYEVLLGQVLKSCDVPSGKKGLYFTETGYHNWLDVSRRIGEVGASLKFLTTAEPRPITKEDAARKWAGGNLGWLENSFCLRNETKPELAIGLGWEPEKQDQDWWKWLGEVCRIVSEEQL